MFKESGSTPLFVVLEATPRLCDRGSVKASDTDARHSGASIARENFILTFTYYVVFVMSITMVLTAD
jgi:hypothetical protein